ncbi:MAG: hypothetical protein ACI959_001867 [Limisphaerales bacterium]|jgi:hypothetical protein
MYLNKFIVLCISILAFFPGRIQACVDNTPSVSVTANYDPVSDNIAIVLSNLNLMGETPNINTFCTCALSNFTDYFPVLEYVAFVDSGTLNVFPGFSVWDANATASSSWGDTVPVSGDWEAFIGEVLNVGLEPTTPVELYIRAKTDPGFLVTFIDSILNLINLGTDEYDEINGVVVNDHNNVVSLSSGGPATVNIVGTDYFDELDDIILNNQVEVRITTTSNAAEIAWQLQTAAGGIVAKRDCGHYADGATESVLVNLPTDTFNFYAFDDIGDGWSGGYYEVIRVRDGVIMASGIPGPSATTDADADCVVVHITPDSASVSLGCNSGLKPDGLSETFTMDGVMLQWEAVPESDACRVQARRTSPMPVITKISLVEDEVNEIFVPNSTLGIGGAVWQWKVACACQISPLIRTPYSFKNTFVVPGAKLVEKASFSISPNPATTELNLTVKEGTELIQIIDLTGKVVLNIDSKVAQFETQMKIDVSDFAPGLYLVSSNGTSGGQTERFTIQ